MFLMCRRKKDTKFKQRQKIYIQMYNYTLVQFGNIAARVESNWLPSLLSSVIYSLRRAPLFLLGISQFLERPRGSFVSCFPFNVNFIALPIFSATKYKVY